MSLKVGARLSKNFVLAVLIGIYGNWLISYLYRTNFSTDMGILSAQVLLVLAVVITFAGYIYTSYYQKTIPELFFIDGNRCY